VGALNVIRSFLLVLNETRKTCPTIQYMHVLIKRCNKKEYPPLGTLQQISMTLQVSTHMIARPTIHHMLVLLKRSLV